ncbi:hypothetical protein KBI33_00980 [Candidatus Shapirobacteria bacterium]|nr:hypothetical protein [Candidatus Shapirobacteria bacterium]
MFNVLAVAGEPTIVVSAPTGWEGPGALTAGSIISGAIQLILIIAALIFFFLLIIGGIRWMTAGGDKEKAGGARGQLTSALIGLAIVFAAWAIIRLIETLFGVSIISGFTIPSFVPKQ